MAVLSGAASASSCSIQCVPAPCALLPASTAAWNAARTDGVSGSHSQWPSTGCPNRPTHGNRQRRRIHGREAAGVHMPASLRGDVGNILRNLPYYSTTGTSRQLSSRRLRLDESDTFRFSTVPVLEPTDSVVPPLVLLVNRRSVTAYDSEM